MLRKDDIECIDNMFLVVINKKGATYLLFSAFINFFYTMTIIFVFYELPKRWFGQFRTLRQGTVSNLTLTASLKPSEFL